eukprot:SAG31_NODE_45424_length_259_cov_0.575000_2_plen_32_part_01
MSASVRRCVEVLKTPNFEIIFDMRAIQQWNTG